MELSHLSESLIGELIHYHQFVFRDIDAEEFDEDQERVKAVIEDENQSCN